MMLLGIYFGENKPNLQQYLKPIFSMLAQGMQPFSVKFSGLPAAEAHKICRVKVLSVPLDMDARVCYFV